jgi:CO/xanthine dehydrogenase Mo-binding subunit
VYDLLEAISVECEKLEAVMTIDEALKGDIMIHEGLQSNVSVDVIYRNGDVEEAFSAADKVVEDEISVHRTFPSPKETRGVVAEWKGGKLHIWASNQGPFRLRDQLAEALGPAEELILKDGWIERKNGERVFAIGELSREEEISAFEFVRGQDIFSYGVHIAVVELDRETYKLKRVQYFAIDDTGRTINPLIAESQIVGESHRAYPMCSTNPSGMVMEGPLMWEAYSKQGSQLPRIYLDIESELYEYPSSYTHGSRGIGEAGTIGSLPCVVSAIEDAIGVRLRSAMLAPDRLWAVVNDLLVRRGSSANHRSIEHPDRDAISEVRR